MEEHEKKYNYFKSKTVSYLQEKAKYFLYFTGSIKW